VLLRRKHRGHPEAVAVAAESPVLLAEALRLHYQFGAHALAVAYALTGSRTEADTIVIDAFCAIAKEWTADDSRPGRDHVMARVVYECELRRIPIAREPADDRATAWLRLNNGQQTVIALTVPRHLS
jgi:hypothetical protein